MSSKDNSCAPALPRGWSVETLEAISSDKQGSLNPLDYPDELFDHYSIPAYQEDGLPATEVGASILSLKQLVCKDTVLFGKLNPRVEKVWLVREKSPRRQIASTEWLPVLPKSAAYNSHYLYYLMWSTHVMPKAQTMVSGSTPSRQRVDPTAFYRIPVPIPPLPEQKKIAAVLSKHWKAVEAQAAIIGNLRELKKSMMNRLFTYGLRGEPLKKTEIGTMPKSWRVARLEEVCEFASGGTPSKQNPSFWMGNIPWVSGKDMKRDMLDDVDDHISAEALDKGSKLVPAQTVLIVVRGMILNRDIPISMTLVPMAFNQDLKAILPRTNFVGGPFVLYAMRAFKEQLQRFIGSSAHGTKTLLSSHIQNFRIPIPSLEEQGEVVRCITVLQKALEIHEAKKSALEDLFKAMLNMLMTGTIRVKDLDIDTSEVA